jgi:hypothetical protein
MPSGFSNMNNLLITFTLFVAGIFISLPKWAMV